jgi:cytochrome c
MNSALRACLWTVSLLLAGAASPGARAADPVAPPSYNQCEGCHAYKKDAAPGIGPNLNGILGRKIAAEKGFAYSAAARAAGFAWTEARLKALIKDPGGYKKYLGKAFHNWRPDMAKTLEAELIPFFRAISPAGKGKK